MLSIACAGEALIDLIGKPDGTYEACMGGAVFNLARALACQGLGTYYLNPLSGDRFGRMLRASLEGDGVHAAQPQAVPEVTSLAVVGLTAEGHPDYAFYREKVADRATSAQSLIAACSAIDKLGMVCTGALALAPGDEALYLPWLQAQKRAGRLLVVDANLRPSVVKDMATYRSNVLSALGLANVIKVSDEDLAALAVPGMDALDCALRLLQNCDASLMALTLGDKGAYLLAKRGAEVRVWRAQETQPVSVVDTVGAGDCFLAGLLSALCQAGVQSPAALQALDATTAQAALAHAVASASLCVMQRGCTPPSWPAASVRAQQVQVEPIAPAQTA